jgi:hypothetical protein
MTAPMMSLNTPNATGSFLYSVFQKIAGSEISDIILLARSSRLVSESQGLTSQRMMDLAIGFGLELALSIAAYLALQRASKEASLSSSSDPKRSSSSISSAASAFSASAAWTVTLTVASDP